MPREHERIVGLDTWRTMLMLAGLLVHGSIWLDAHPLFLLIDLVSKSFRMGVFFAISGFLASRAIIRHGTSRWLRTRLVQLGIPALFGVSVLSPLMWSITVLHADPRTPIPLLFDWYHLWFLYGLLLYSGAVAAGYRSARVRRWCATATTHLVEAPHGLRITLLAAALVSALSLGSVAAAMQSTLPAAYAAAFNQVSLIAAYLPMFLLGFATGSSASIRHRVLAVKGVGVILTLLVVACVATTAARFCLPQPFGEQIEAKVRLVGATLGPPFAFVAVMRAALLITHVGPLTRRLSDASYTIYLLHAPALSISNAALVRSSLHPIVAYAISIVAAGVICYLFHVHVVRRVAVLALLLNGRVAAGRTPIGVAAPN